MIKIKKSLARTLLFFAGVCFFNLALTFIEGFLLGDFQGWYIFSVQVLFILLLVLESVMLLDRAFDPAIAAGWLLRKGEIVEVVEEQSRPRGVALEIRLPYKKSGPFLVRFGRKQQVTPGEGLYLFDGKKLKPMTLAV